MLASMDFRIFIEPQQGATYDDQLAVARAAEQLGFSEPSAFHRAFKKWTGLTPGAYRAQES